MNTATGITDRPTILPRQYRIPCAQAALLHPGGPA